MKPKDGIALLQTHTGKTTPQSTRANTISRTHPNASSFVDGETEVFGAGFPKASLVTDVPATGVILETFWFPEVSVSPNWSKEAPEGTGANMEDSEPKGKDAVRGSQTV